MIKPFTRYGLRSISLALSLLLVWGSAGLPFALADVPVAEISAPARVREMSWDYYSEDVLALDGAAQQEILARVIPIVRAKAQVPERLS